VQFIHFTDLHYRNDNPFQKALTEALIIDLQGQVASGISPDFLVFSGDLVNNPDDPGIYQEFDTHFLKPILTSLNFRPEQVILCPGNHDVSHKVVAEWTDQRSQLKADLASRSSTDLGGFLKSGPMQSYLKAISRGFYSLAQKYGASWSDPAAHVYSFEDQKVSFVSMNSAVGCGPEGSEHDRGKLAFPSSLALAAFQKVPKDHYVVSLLHHTVADFNESTSRTLVPLIQKYASIHCFGHVHQALPSANTIAGGSCFMLQGAALYENQPNNHGYSTVRISDTGNRVEASYRTYYVDRSTFDIGTNVGPGGKFFNSDDSKTYWETLVPSATNDDYCYWLLETAEPVIIQCDGTMVGKSLSETFVEPFITRPKSPDAASATTRPVTIDEILKSREHIVIAADHEFGSTALISYIAMEFHRRCYDLDVAMVPAVLDARKVKSYKAAITAALRGALPDSDDPRFKLQALHDANRLVVLVDDLDPTNQDQVAFIVSLRASYPKARLVTIAKLALLDIQGLRPVIGGGEFDYLQLRELSRGKVRTLISNWKMLHLTTDLLVDEITTRFRSLGIPRTAPYVVIYLSVMQDTNGFNPINSSTVIEQFVEGVLEKYRPSYLFRSSFDYRNQIDYLAAIAQRMCEKDEFMAEYSILYDWTKEYFDGIGQEHDYTKLIDHFIQNKIFAYEGNNVYFRYNIFLSFFIAHQMLNSKSFRDWILTPPRYMTYINEVDIYCGLSRNDVESLDLLAAEFSKYSKEMATLIEPLAWEDRLERLTLPPMDKKDQEAFVDSINKQLTSSTETRDEAISKGEQQHSVKPALKRAEQMGLIPHWIMALRAYSVALKNLENISRAKKEEHLQKILEGWATVMRYACIAFRDSIEAKGFEIGSLKFKIDLPKELDSRILRLLFLNIPLVVSHWLRRDLGTQKLSLQLKNGGLAKSIPEAFLQTGLYADLKLPEYLMQLRKLFTKSKDSQLFLEVLMVKLQDIYLRLGLDDTEQKAFLDLAADISADLKGLKGPARTAERSRYSESLKRREQVAKLRDGKR
jgi:3',5'-cyclic AMP phosphodiesterase CpdA